MDIVRLGDVTTHTGTLAFVDASLLSAWPPTTQHPSDEAHVEIWELEGRYVTLVDELPQETSFAVFAEIGEEGAVQAIVVDIDPEVDAIADTEIGHVDLAEHLLLIADPDVLDVWQDEDAIDGLADVIFVGRDAGVAAGHTRAPTLNDELRTFGWRDLSVGKAERKARELAQFKEHHEAEFEVEIHQHSHTYLLRQAAQESDQDAGTLRVGDATVFGILVPETGAYHLRAVSNDAGAWARLVIDLA